MQSEAKDAGNNKSAEFDAMKFQSYLSEMDMFNSI